MFISCCFYAGSIVANPFFIAKTRMQSYSEANPVGHQHNYRGPIHALVSIFREEGFRGLFRGTKAGCIRISVASAVQLTTYDQSKAAVLWMGVKEGIHVHIGASIVSGIFLALVLNPFDVITTRLYNQEVKHGVGMLYQGWLDCVIKIWKTEGFIGFYKVHSATIVIFLLLLVDTKMTGFDSTLLSISSTYYFNFRLVRATEESCRQIWNLLIRLNQSLQ